MTTERQPATHSRALPQHLKFAFHGKGLHMKVMPRPRQKRRKNIELQLLSRLASKHPNWQYPGQKSEAIALVLFNERGQLNEFVGEV